MVDELALRTAKTPTIFNKDMAIGAIAGNYIGGFLGGMLGSFAGPASGFTGMLIGRAVGMVGVGFLRGRKREKEMQQELTHGKVVSRPTFWNKDTLLGALIGVLAGHALGGIAAQAVVASAAVLTAPVAAGALGVIAVGLIGGALMGAVIGGKKGEQRMAGEYREAELQLAQSQEAARAGNVAQTQAVSMPTRSFRQQVELERQLEAQKNRTV